MLALLAAKCLVTAPLALLSPFGLGLKRVRRVCGVQGQQHQGSDAVVAVDDGVEGNIVRNTLLQVISAFLFMCVGVCVGVRVCVCVCEGEREREREGGGERQGQREREEERELSPLCAGGHAATRTRPGTPYSRSLLACP